MWQQRELFTVEGKHLPLIQLKEELQEKNLYNTYLEKNDIPTYPRPELLVHHVSHCTNLWGLQGIGRDGGFRDRTHFPPLVWFSVTATPDELRGAATRNMTVVPPGEPERELRAGPADGPQELGVPSGPAGGPWELGALSGPADRPRELGAPSGPADGPRELGAPSGPSDGPRELGAPSGPSDGPRELGAPSGPADGLREIRADKRRALSAIENFSDFTLKRRREQTGPEQVLEGPSAGENLLKGPSTEERPTVEGGPSAVGRGILWNFATSPAFKSSSRYGSFRFTFSLKDVLDKYSQQFCAGQEPVLRVYHTDLYKQEVMYAVLVHSPANNWKFSKKYPLLEESSICEFRAEPEPHFVWRPQAMSETHRWELVEDGPQLQVKEVMGRPQFYVWDHVTLALHVDKVLQFEDHELRENVRFCEKDQCSINKGISYQTFEDAEAEVKELWPQQQHLEKFNQSELHITD